MAEVIKGSAVVAPIKERLQNHLSKDGKKPVLTVIRVGDNPSEISYQKSVFKRLDPLGIDCRAVELSADLTQEEFDQAFDKVNQDSDVNGILLLKPVPQHISLDHVVETIDPLKDVDCIGAYNMFRIYNDGEKGFLPCTAEAVMRIIEHQGIELKGKKVALVGFGMVIGRPLTLLMVEAGATVTICHEFTKDTPAETRDADVLVTATGVVRLITPDHVNENTTVIDVGINVDENGKLCGDVDYENVEPVVKAITPVPGGVGGVTTFVLGDHVVRSFDETNK